MELQPLGPEESASYAVSACSSHVGPINFVSCAPANMQSMTRRRLSITEWTAKGYLDRNILFNRVSQRTRDDDGHKTHQGTARGSGATSYPFLPEGVQPWCLRAMIQRAGGKLYMKVYIVRSD